MDAYKAIYIKGWGVARLNPNKTAISKMIKRFSSKREADDYALKLNLTSHPLSCG